MPGTWLAAEDLQTGGEPTGTKALGHPFTPVLLKDCASPVPGLSSNSNPQRGACIVRGPAVQALQEAHRAMVVSRALYGHLPALWHALAALGPTVPNALDRIPV